MRRLLLSSSLALAASLGFSLPTQAQDPSPSPADAPASPSAPSTEDSATGSAPAADPLDGEAETFEGDAPEQPRVLEPPKLPELDVVPDAPALPDPGADAVKLERAAPPALPERRGWTLPQTVIQLHGYMRLRGTFLKDGALGHRTALDRQQFASDGTRRANYDPFPFFDRDDRVNREVTAGEAATTNSAGEPVIGGCGKDPSSGGVNGSCSKRGQVSGDLRFRLKPEIHLSDDVRVKAWIDVLDNVGLGTMGYGPGYQPAELSGETAIRARRVWGEARNRDIGELRFGRMGADWGLGILDNGGDRYGIDSDFSTEVDRLMGITNLGGFYFMAAYDWASEGRVLGKIASPSGVPLDLAQKDDHDAFTFSIARKLEEGAQQSALTRGESVLNYGVYFIYRKQLLRVNLPAGDEQDTSDRLVESGGRYARVNRNEFIPDLWVQFLWEGLRIELEAVFRAGRQENCARFDTSTQTYESLAAAREVVGGSCKFRQLGIALETEYRLFDERLGLHLAAGVASGDAEARGLAATNSPELQRTASSDIISTFEFHPDYRIDLILWRTLMRRVAGAYYAKPGVSYDFIRDPYGQLAGGRVDVIYSRAAAADQTWGGDPNLGLELDLSLYYRSEDGPDPLDGFYGLVQWGVLFPFSGLGQELTGLTGAPQTRNAMVLRGIAGIAF